MVNVFNNFFITIIKKFKIQQIQKGDVISILKDSFRGNFHSKNTPNLWKEIKSIIHSLQPKKSSGYDEIMRKVLNACASLLSHPLNYIYTHSLYTGILTILKLQ